MCYNEQKSKLRPYTNPSNKIKRQLFGILNFGHCDLPFDFAQGGESFDSTQDREPVERLAEPFGICVLIFDIFHS
jgi:hypothetical protein